VSFCDAKQGARRMLRLHCEGGGDLGREIWESSFDAAQPVEAIKSGNISMALSPCGAKESVNRVVSDDVSCAQ